MSPSSRVALRSNSDFRRLWCARFASSVGFQGGIVAFPLLVLSTTGSPLKAGVVGFVNYLTLLVSLPAGWLADRLDRRRVMFTASLVEAIALSSIPLAFLLGEAPGFGQIVAVAFIQGAMTELVVVAEQGALVHVVGPDLVADAVASNEARVSAAIVIGPPLGGALFGLGRAIPFAANAMFSLIAVFSVHGVRQPLQEPAEQHDAGASFAQVLVGMRWLWRQPFFRAAALAGAAGNVTWGAIDIVLIVRAKEHGASSVAIGVMIAMMGIGGIVGSFLASPLRSRLSASWLLRSVFLFEGMLLSLMILTSNPYLLGLIVAVATLGGAAWNSAIVSARLLASPDRLRARVGAAARLITSTLLPFGVLGAGILLNAFGSTTTAVYLASWQLAVAALLFVAPGVRAGLPEETIGIPARAPG